MSDKIIDISWPISEDMTTYKDRKLVEFKKNKKFPEDQVCDSSLTINSHVGTHVDSPAHFVEGGKTIEAISLQSVVGPCRVLDFSFLPETIQAKDLEKCDIYPGEIILLKTKNSSLSPEQKFEKSFVYLERSGAEFLVSKRVKAVGIDYLGVERDQPDHATHIVLFKNEIVVIEGLRLDRVVEGKYFLCCLPLFVQKLEAAPARAVLVAN